MNPTDVVVEEFVRIANETVWCSVATVDAEGRPRQRVLHPIWEIVAGRPVGWVVTARTGVKADHLEANPHVACSYWSPTHDIAYADCVASWEEDPDTRRHVFALFHETPPPLGYDIGALGDADNPLFTPLRLVPWRVQAFDGTDFPTRGFAMRTWRAAHHPSVPSPAPVVQL